MLNSNFIKKYVFFSRFFYSTPVFRGTQFGKRCLKEKRILEFKEEALDRILWRTGFGRGFGLS